MLQQDDNQRTADTPLVHPVVRPSAGVSAPLAPRVRLKSTCGLRSTERWQGAISNNAAVSALHSKCAFNVERAGKRRLCIGGDTFFTYALTNLLRNASPREVGAAALPCSLSCRAAGVRLSNLGAHLQLAQPGDNHGPDAALVPRDHLLELGGAQRLQLDPAVVA